MLRTRHVSVDLSARARERDRLDRNALSDSVLVARARDGDRRSRDVLVERYADRVARIARARFHDPEEARDAAQEALGRVVEQLSTFRGASSSSDLPSSTPPGGERSGAGASSGARTASSPVHRPP